MKFCVTCSIYDHYKQGNDNTHIIKEHIIQINFIFVNISNFNLNFLSGNLAKFYMIGSFNLMKFRFNNNNLADEIDSRVDCTPFRRFGVFS